MGMLAVPPVGIDTADWRAVVMAANLIWQATNDKPTAVGINKYCPSLTLERIKVILQSEEFTAAMVSAGIPWRDGTDGLSPKQMMTLQVMANPLGGGNTATRLKKAGTTAREWAAWKKIPVFKEAWERLSYDLLIEHEGELKAELLRQALDGGGKLDAIKYIHELTGAHSPHEQKLMDMQAFVQRILLIIQSEIGDAEVLQRIANRIMQEQVVPSTPQRSNPYQEILSGNSDY